MKVALTSPALRALKQSKATSDSPKSYVISHPESWTICDTMSSFTKRRCIASFNAHLARLLPENVSLKLIVNVQADDPSKEHARISADLDQPCFRPHADSIICANCLHLTACLNVMSCSKSRSGSPVPVGT